jgi:xanthine dehydrogenase accessory factor
VKLALLDALVAARAAKQPVALATWLDGSDQQLLAPVDAPADLADAIADALRLDAAKVVETARGMVLVEPHNPPLRLIIVGAVHVAEPLSKIATLAGFAVTIVDPRRSWATPARFPDQQLVLEWPDAAIGTLAPDSRTAVVTLTHDPKLDDPALIAALASPAFYLGCLGSKKTHAARLERLAAAGCTRLERLHGPVGIPIGAKSPTEIAVSIFAQVIATLRGAA